jgi:hypothetical protein
MGGDSPSFQETFDRTLAAYQKFVFFLLYPPLLSLLSSVFGAFDDDYDYYLSLTSQRTLMIYLWGNPLGANLALSLVLGVSAAAVIAGAGVFLTLKALKGKRWALLLGGGAYFLDFVYLCFLLMTPFVGSMEWGTWLVQMFLHLAFFVLFALALAKYGKLVRLRKEDRQH